jgi:hypothetical protein
MPFGTFLRTTTMLSGAVGATFLAVYVVHAADVPVKAAPYQAPLPLPAVSGLNFNVTGFGGYARVDDVGPGEKVSGGLGGAGATMVAPIGHAYGLKLSGLVGGWEGEAFYGGSAHLFWRDPAIGLLGVYGSYTRADASVGAALGRLAIEFQRYLGQYSIDGQIGWEGVDVDSSIYTRLDLGYYLNENLKLKIGHRYTDHRHLLAVGAEAQFLAGNNAWSGFVEGRFGSDYSVAWAGLRLYFGGAPKSLIRRHREDDPGNHTTDATDDLIALRNEVKTHKSSKPTDPCAGLGPGYIFIPGEGCIFVGSS